MTGQTFQESRSHCQVASAPNCLSASCRPTTWAGDWLRVRDQLPGSRREFRLAEFHERALDEGAVRWPPSAVCWRQNRGTIEV